MKRQFTFIISLVALFIMVAACSNASKEAPKETAAPATTTAPADTASAQTKPQFAVDASFKQQLSAVFNAYLGVKDAFVASDAAKVKAEVAALQEALSHVDMKLLTGAAHHDWMSYLPAMEFSIKEIAATSDIESQRKAFQPLSENLYKSIKAYGLAGTTAYYEYCPMAFNNAGASWLSNSAQIRNPYFGNAMLTCGSVKETLR